MINPLKGGRVQSPGQRMEKERKEMFASTTDMTCSAAAVDCRSAVADNLAVLDPVTNTKGQKNALVVRGASSLKAFWVLPSPVKCLFQPTAFKGVQGEAVGRLSMCVSGDELVMNDALALDAWAISYATEHSERLFGKKYTSEQVTDRYNAIVKKSDKYPAFIKLKLGTEKNAPNYWSPAKEKQGAPEDFTVCEFQCKALSLIHI